MLKVIIIYLMEEDYPYREFVFRDGTEAARFFKYKENREKTD
jgi:hypothetical protein